MRFTLKDIEAFLRVAETGSITQAAARSNMAKSVLSKRISDLELTLGATLIHRSTRGITLTGKGMIFYERARAGLHQLNEAVEEMRDAGGSFSGSIRISAPVNFGTRYLEPILFRFLQEHPKLAVVVDLEDRFVDVSREGYDLAVRIGNLSRSSLTVVERIASSPNIVCCSPDYAERAGLPADLESLCHYDAIGYAHYAPTPSLWEFLAEESHGKLCAVPMRCRLIVNSGEATRDAAIAGLGLAVLPHFIAAEPLRSGQLINALPLRQPMPRHIYAVYPANRHPLRTVRALIGHLQKALRHSPRQRSN